ncbi:hypothetical protein AG1IA_10034 [Rhizoctonia solani AG-1 IA]|uniref:Uncharacterized protein n=1 Tax=Thanatephorus cucumeris (strain AG1-IA) TaxID=983506 RepID=L8WCN6_THACA|nr:hypothetical protein AG1IA_10034 [Rhizoctonia solani AG-1 IA]
MPIVTEEQGLACPRPGNTLRTSDGAQNSSCESRFRTHPSSNTVSPPAIARCVCLSSEAEGAECDRSDTTPPPGAFHTRIVKSYEPETTCLPSGEYATEATPF